MPKFTIRYDPCWIMVCRLFAFFLLLSLYLCVCLLFYFQLHVSLFWRSFSSRGTIWLHFPLWVWFAVVLPSSDPDHSFLWACNDVWFAEKYSECSRSTSTTWKHQRPLKQLKFIFSGNYYMLPRFSLSRPPFIYWNFNIALYEIL